MFSLIYLIGLVLVLVSSAPQNQPGTSPIPIIQFNSNINPDGSYQYNYETGNGIKAEESGSIQNPGTDNEAMKAVGSYEYTDPEGNLIRVQYVADENGFQPVGDHLPTPPPIPQDIQRALDYIATAPTLSPVQAQQARLKRSHKKQ